MMRELQLICAWFFFDAIVTQAHAAILTALVDVGAGGAERLVAARPSDEDV